MQRSPAWQATDALTRLQLQMFQALGDQISLSPEDRRRALGLDDRLWRAWADFLADGPLPDEPEVPEMLRRVATAAYRMSMAADRGGAGR